MKMKIPIRFHICPNSRFDIELHIQTLSIFVMQYAISHSFMQLNIQFDIQLHIRFQFHFG